jgi:hypothetical protein
MTLRRFPLPKGVRGAAWGARWLSLRGVLVPVVVYQMAKVGSSAVVHALVRSRLPVFHVHRIHPANIERVRARRRELGWRDYPRVARHEQMARQIRERVLATRKPARFITLVKDPIARNLSSYFEHLDAIWGVDDAHEKVPLQDLCDGFATRYPHEEPLNWFDHEVLPVLGIDVYTQPFPAEGHVVLRSPLYELLVVKSEIPDETKRDAIANFLGGRVAAIGRANRTEATAKGKVYKEFMRRVELSAAHVEEMLGARYTAHFYDPAEREALRQRYLRLR